MAYGLVGDGVDTFGPTICGMKKLREAVQASLKHYPTLLNFVEQGAVNNPQQLSIECNQFAKIESDADIKATAINIAKAAIECKEKLSLC